MPKYYPKYKILKKLSKCSEMSTIDLYNGFCRKGHFNPPIHVIKSVLKKSIEDGLIKTDLSDLDSAKIKITPSGREYLQNTFDKAILFWIPYVITTIIAVAALMVSVSDVLQQGCPNNRQTPPACDRPAPCTDTVK